LVVTFGKYVDRTIECIQYTLNEYSYIAWLLQQVWIPEYQKDWLRAELDRLKELHAEKLAQAQGNLFV